MTWLLVHFMEQQSRWWQSKELLLRKLKSRWHYKIFHVQVFSNFSLWWLTAQYVSGLAHHVHDSSTLHEKFDRLVQEDTELEGSMQMLTRHVPTWWNSGFDCLKAHIHFKSIVQSLTGVAANKLQAYRLTDSQWKLAEDLTLILEVFNFLISIPY